MDVNSQYEQSIGRVEGRLEGLLVRVRTRVCWSGLAVYPYCSIDPCRQWGWVQGTPGRDRGEREGGERGGVKWGWVQGTPGRDRGEREGGERGGVKWGWVQGTPGRETGGC